MHFLATFPLILHNFLINRDFVQMKWGKNALGFAIEMQKRVEFWNKISSKIITEYPDDCL